jgi:hypothetical protein
MIIWGSMLNRITIITTYYYIHYICMLYYHSFIANLTNYLKLLQDMGYDTDTNTDININKENINSNTLISQQEQVSMKLPFLYC